MVALIRITPEQHLEAIRDLVSHPDEPDRADRVIDYATREPEAAHAAHMLVSVMDGSAAPGERLEFDNLDIPEPALNYSPRTLDELEQMIEGAVARELPIKAIGAGYALSDIDRTVGCLLNMGTHFVRIAPLPASEMTGAGGEILYEVEAGASIDEVNKALWNDGYALYNQPGFERLTLVGTASVGGHGSGQKLGGIAESLRAIRVLCFDANGKLRRLHVEPTAGFSDRARFSKRDGFTLVQDDDTFYSLAVGLGALGVISSVVVAVRPKYFLRERRTFLPWPEVAGRLQELRTGDLQSFAVWLNPYPRGSADPTCLLSTYEECSGPAQGERGIGITLGGSNLLAEVIVWWVAHCPSALPELMDSALRSAADSDVVMPCTEALNFGAPNHLHVASSACGIDADSTRDAVAYVTEFAARFAARGCHITSPIGLRFVAAAKSYLSPQFGRQTCMIEVPILAGTENSGECLDAFQDEMFARFQARPHWGQRTKIDEEHARKLYPKFDAFKATAKSLGAGAWFANDRLKALGLT